MKTLLLLFCLGMFAAGTALADVTVGLPADPNTGNCFPFGCAYSGEYQQVYTHTAFSGPITITDLHFFNTQFDNGATAMNTGTWTISLSTTSADWDTLSSTFADNIGADNTQVFSGDLSQPWAFGDTLSILLSTPYTYDPASGNLLMDVQVSGASAPGGDIYFDVKSGTTIISRVTTFEGETTVAQGYGLVTEFTTSTSPVPEPSFGILLGVGLGLVGVANRLRRNLRRES